MLPRWTFALTISIVCLPALAAAGDWTQFRGPDGSAVSAEKGLPAEWAADKNVAWKVKLPGYAWSCPVIVGDKVFVTTAVTDKQQKPGGGMGGFGGPGAGGPGGFGGFPQPGQIIASPLQERLKLTDEQKKQLEELQKDADAQLDKLLTDEQKKQLKDMREAGGRGGFGGFGGGRPPDSVYKFEVLCLDRKTGETLWSKTAVERKPTIPSFNKVYATETPVTDGERVYAYFGMHGIFCYDLEGKEIWHKDLGSHPMAMGFGTGSSPVLADGRLFVQCDNEEKSFVIAFEAKTGKQLWKMERPGRSSWSTPLVWKTKQRTEVVACGDKKVISYDPESGKVLWELGGITGTFQSSPVADAERIYFGSGGPMGDNRLIAVKAGASGDITPKRGEKSTDAIAWIQRSAPYLASPLVYDGYIYVLESRGGILRCYNARTGEEAYKERLTGARGFTSSPWAYEGKVFFLDEDGTTHVVQAGAEFKELGTNTLGEMCWSSPAVGGGALLLRTVDHLYCLKQKTAEK